MPETASFRDPDELAILDHLIRARAPLGQGQTRLEYRRDGQRQAGTITSLARVRHGFVTIDGTDIDLDLVTSVVLAGSAD